MKYYKTDNRADYAEMFESISEFADKKIPRGTSVALVGEKIRPAKQNEIPFGVISSFPIMLGGNGGFEWSGKYLRDEFGNYIFHEVEKWYSKDKDGRAVRGYTAQSKAPKGSLIKMKREPMINPEYDKNKPYVTRMERIEWNMVGLVGKLKILKGQPVDPRWIKLKDINDEVEEWLIR